MIKKGPLLLTPERSPKSTLGKMSCLVWNCAGGRIERENVHTSNLRHSTLFFCFLLGMKYTPLYSLVKVIFRGLTAPGTRSTTLPITNEMALHDPKYLSTFQFIPPYFFNMRDFRMTLPISPTALSCGCQGSVPSKGLGI